MESQSLILWSGSLRISVHERLEGAPLRPGLGGRQPLRSILPALEVPPAGSWSRRTCRPVVLGERIGLEFIATASPGSFGQGGSNAEEIRPGMALGRHSLGGRGRTDPPAPGTRDAVRIDLHPHRPIDRRRGMVHQLAKLVMIVLDLLQERGIDRNRAGYDGHRRFSLVEGQPVERHP